MSPLLDAEGRLFGRANIVDVLSVTFLIALVPAAYASLLLLRPARPRIDSVTRAEPNREDRRIANGVIIRMKLKVHGDHLTPNLRAYLDDVEAIGFTFETPQSADVIVGDVPLGTHDLILFDGVQEVARAARAVVIAPAPTAFVRIAGAFVHLDRSTADALHQQQRFEVDGQTAAEVLALGPTEADRQPIDLGARKLETPVAAAWRRAVVLRVYCEPDPDTARCRIGGRLLGDPTTTMIDVPGTATPLKLRIGDVAPDAAPFSAVARIRVAAPGEARGRIRTGDKDIRGESIDERTASIVEVSSSSSAALEIAVRLGVDRTREGWRYKGVLLAPGEPFTFAGLTYAVSGVVLNVVVDER